MHRVSILAEYSRLHGKWRCTGKVIWQRKKEEHRYDAERFKDPTSRPVAWRKTHESHCLCTLRTTGYASAQEVAKPTLRDHEVLIRIDATTVTAADCELSQFTLPIWLRLPIRLYLGLIRPRNKILDRSSPEKLKQLAKTSPDGGKETRCLPDRFGFWGRMRSTPACLKKGCWPSNRPR